MNQAAGRRPRRISITVADTAEGGAELTIADDGHLERRRESVEAIEERVRMLSGVVTVDRSEHGTTVKVALPGYAIRS